MRLRHVLLYGCMEALLKAPCMACDASTLVEYLDGGQGNTNVQLLFQQLIRHAVIMPVHLYVIVDIDPGLFPLGVFVGSWRKR